MKSIFSVLCFLFFFSVASAQLDQMVVISGKLKSDVKPKEISLQTVSDGEPQLHSKVSIAQDGSFGFCLKPPYEGFYTLTWGKTPVRVFLKAGLKTSLEMNDTSYVVTNKLDLPNTLLERWAKLLWPMKKANVLGSELIYSDVFPVLPDYEKKKNAFLATVKTPNLQFNQLCKSMINSEFEKELYHFLFMPRSAHPKKEDFPEIYARLSNAKHFETAEVLKCDFGASYVNMFLQFHFVMKNEQKQWKSFEAACLGLVLNDTVKGTVLISNNLLRSQTYDAAYQSRYEQTKKYILTDAQKKKVADFESTIRKMGVGELAIPFAGKTIDGKEVKLSDFKGKVVVVDVWATWCGPCKKQIPFWKKLSEEMKDKDVVFLSYSIDDKKDMQKWKDAVSKETGHGVQIVGEDGFKSDICKSYKITGIPRFMLFDKNGNIVSVDAPRPEQPELKSLIEKTLAK